MIQSYICVSKALLIALTSPLRVGSAVSLAPPENPFAAEVTSGRGTWGRCLRGQSSPEADVTGWRGRSLALGGKSRRKQVTELRVGGPKGW